MEDSALESRLKPFVETAIQKYLGIRFAELEKEVSQTVQQVFCWKIIPDTRLPFRLARDSFRKKYLVHLLSVHCGNIAEVARLLSVDRRTVHRLITKLNINADSFRQIIHRPEYVRTEVVSSAMTKVFDNYKSTFHPEKISNLYKNVHDISKTLLKQLPEKPLSLKQAEKEFEKEYFTSVLKMFGWNISASAKHMKLRAETLHRKIVGLGLKRKELCLK